MTDSTQFQAKISFLFMAVTVLLSSLCSFGVGHLSKRFVENEMTVRSSINQKLGLSSQPGAKIEYDNTNPGQSLENKMTLPVPLAKGGKEVPVTIYTSKNFDTRRSSYSSQWLQKEVQESSNASNDVPSPVNVKLSDINETISEHGTIENGHEAEEEHLPAGQHLLVDIDGIDESFLNSESRLATAMIQLVDNSGLTLLSYHCHGLTPAGVSCAGVLLESHVSFHTWPVEGVITLDLFTCGSTSLLGSLGLIEELFAVPRENHATKPKVLWAYKRRGFKEQSSLVGQRDTFAYPLGIHGLEYKKEIVSSRTVTGKDVRIYDIDNTYQLKSPFGTTHGISKETADNFVPSLNRLLYINGVLKGCKLSEVPAYESFVHPVMFVHSKPEKVLILGAGAGASIRETLKHLTVKQVTVLGADRALMDISRESLHSWNDCSDLVGSTSNCFDDSRVELIYEKPLEWVTSHPSKVGPFDVILVNPFDMDEDDASTLMGTKNDFFHKMQSLLAENGVISVHVTGDFRSVDTITKKGKKIASPQESRQAKISSELLNAGFEETKVYEEAETGLIEGRSYVVGLKQMEAAQNWNRNAAEVNAELKKRVVQTKSGNAPLKFFDGSTMVSYSRPLLKDIELKGTSYLKKLSGHVLVSRTAEPISDFSSISVQEKTCDGNQSTHDMPGDVQAPERANVAVFKEELKNINIHKS